jgi:hypothetical protein
MNLEDQIRTLEPSARDFMNATLDMKRGAAAINFDHGIVVCCHDSVPGSAEFRLAVKKLFDGLQDKNQVGTV